MKRYYFLLLLLTPYLSFGQKNITDSIYSSPEIPAKFLFGEKELNEFISANLIIPFDARHYGVNGVVKIYYLIDKSGSISDIKVIDEKIDLGVGIDFKEHLRDEDIKGFFSTEAKRVVLLLSGLYQPALDSGRIVHSALSITLNFNTKQYDENKRSYDQQKHLARLRSNYQFVFTFGNYTGKEPDYAKLRYDYGVLKMNENKLELCCKYFEEAVRIKQDFIDAYYNLGIAYKKLKRSKEACIAWNKAKELGDGEVEELLNKYCNQ